VLLAVAGAGPGRTAHNSFETEINGGTVNGLVLKWTATGDGGAITAPVTSLRGVHVSDPVGFYAFSFDTGAPALDDPGATQRPLRAGAGGRRRRPGRARLRLRATSAATGRRPSRTPPPAPDLGSNGAGQGLVDGLRGNILLTRSVGFGTGTPLFTAIHVSDFASPANSWTSTIDFSNGGSTRALTLGSTRIYQAGRGIPTPTGSTNAVRAFLVATPPAQCPPPAPAGFGCPAWATDIAGTLATPPVINDDETVVYTGTDTGAVYALDAATGAILWTSNKRGSGQVTDTPALCARVVVRTDDQRAGRAGRRHRRPQVGGRRRVRPGSARGGGRCRPSTGAEDGRVMAFDAFGCGQPFCPPLWNVDTGDAAITGAPGRQPGPALRRDGRRPAACVRPPGLASLYVRMYDPAWWLTDRAHATS
jgi:hypothetical protein